MVVQDNIFLFPFFCAKFKLMHLLMSIV